MGYSCNAASAFALDWIRDNVSLKLPAGTSNGMPDGGFWEVGRENASGAITGTVWKPWAEDPSRVVRRGGFRIEPDGRVSRFPGLSAAQCRAAGEFSAKRMREVYGVEPQKSCPACAGGFPLEMERAPCCGRARG